MKYLFILLIFISCTDKNKDSAAVVENEDVSCFDSEKFGLELISQESDLLHIRVWYYHSFLDRVPVISIRQRESFEWTSDIYYIIWDLESTLPTIKEIKTKELRPQTSWEQISSKLIDLHILTLPDMDSIPKLENYWLDGSSYMVEIERDKLCYLYRYHLPEKFEKEFWQAKNMVDILESIESEFGLVWKLDGETTDNFWEMANDLNLQKYER